MGDCGRIPRRGPLDRAHGLETCRGYLLSQHGTREYEVALRMAEDGGVSFVSSPFDLEELRAVNAAYAKMARPAFPSWDADVLRDRFLCFGGSARLVLKRFLL